LHLINFVYDNPISITQSGSAFSATVSDASRLKGVTRGIGIFVFRYGPTSSEITSNWTRRFLMNEETLVDTGSSSGTGNVNLPNSDPCSGVVSSYMEGFLAAPAMNLKMRDGRDVVIMRMSPRKGGQRIALAKTAISLSEGETEVQIFLTASDGVECTGTVSGTEFKRAQITLTRIPDYSDIQRGFPEILAETTSPGPIRASWKPVTRSFGEVLAVFRPSEIQDSDLERILQLIGAGDGTFLGDKESSFVIGDGKGTRYTLSLTMERTLRPNMIDETILTLS